MPFSRFFNFWNLKKTVNFKWKNLCDKVLKIKILNWQFCCIFHGLCRGISHFFCKCHIFREICKIELPLFSIFIKKHKKKHFERQISIFSRHLFIYFFGYARYANFFSKDVKGPVQFHEKMSPGEALEREWFGDIRLIGMYLLGDSSHMALDFCHMEYSIWHHKTAIWSTPYGNRISPLWWILKQSIWHQKLTIWSTPCGMK